MRNKEIRGIETILEASPYGVAEAHVLRLARGEQQGARDLPDTLGRVRRLGLRDRLLQAFFEFQEQPDDAQMV